MPLQANVSSCAFHNNSVTDSGAAVNVDTESQVGSAVNIAAACPQIRVNTLLSYVLGICHQDPAILIHVTCHCGCHAGLVACQMQPHGGK
jgi:hypothetical protein